MDDSAVLQEIKTTSGNDLSLADTLPDDYKKLFGTDPANTIKSRLASVKNLVEFSLGLPQFATRINRFIGVDPLTCQNVQLLPTLVYDPLNAPQPAADRKMLVVKTTIYGLGWPPSSVSGWTIGLDALDGQLQNLAEGL